MVLGIADVIQSAANAVWRGEWRQWSPDTATTHCRSCDLVGSPPVGTGWIVANHNFLGICQLDRGPSRFS
jgi:hypothetical protein